MNLKRITLIQRVLTVLLLGITAYVSPNLHDALSTLLI